MNRGRFAKTPVDIPAKGWLDVCVRVWKAQTGKHLSLLAAGVAFYGLLSIFPAITAIMALAGIVADPSFIATTSAELAMVVPADVRDIILGQLNEVVGTDDRALGLAALAALALALYSASKATGNFIISLNIINDETDGRGFFKRQALTIGLTMAMMVGLALCLAVVAALPLMAGYVSGVPMLAEVMEVARWPILFGFGVAGISVLYRYGPDRKAADWIWLTPGATFACVLWVLGSMGFSAYVQSFGTYNETFGALGGVIVLLTWLWLSAYIVMIGATIDAEMEAQTRHDTTVGPDKPLGRREAVKADTLGPTGKAARQSDLPAA